MKGVRLLLSSVLALVASAAFSADLQSCGLLLLKTEPSGCDIQLEGTSLGVTPRVITSLALGEAHALTLRKAGYLDQTVTVRFDGRHPQVRTVAMVSASGTLDLVSDPSNAEVTVNGVVRGRTPLVVTEVPKGAAMVKFCLVGYQEEVRELTVAAGDRQTLSVALRGLPGTLHLSSVPEGARFYVNGEFRGKGTQDLVGLKPGKYELRAELQGHATVRKTVQLGNGQSLREEFRLTNVMGRLELRSSPVGAQVFLDGQCVGVTKAADPDAEFSDIFAIENVLEGEHTVVLKKEGYQDLTRHPKVVNSKTSKHHKMRMTRVFLPDVELVTVHGTYRGVLVRNSADAIEIEVSLGVTRSFKRDEIRNLRFLKLQK